MIVKVQLSVKTTEPVRQVLIYNQGQSVHFEGGADESLLKKVEGQLKSFWHAQILGPRNRRAIVLGDPAPWQDW